MSDLHAASVLKIIGPHSNNTPLSAIERLKRRENGEKPGFATLTVFRGVDLELEYRNEPRSAATIWKYTNFVNDYDACYIPDELDSGVQPNLPEAGIPIRPESITGMIWMLNF